MLGRMVSFAALLIVAAFLMYPVTIAGSNLDFIWGSMPSNIRIIGVENLGEADSLRSGEWFQITYEIKVTKSAWDSEESVREEVIHHFQEFLGRTIREHPELRIYYAEYICYRTENHVLTRDYYYRVKIIGKVEPIQLSNGTRKPLVPWVTVAVIVGLVVAAIVATIVLVQQPAVQRLLVSASEAIHTIATNPLLAGAWTFIVAALATTFLILVLLAATASLRRKRR